MTTSQKRAEEFLEKAKEAEKQAAKTANTVARESWLRVASGYRDLAQRQNR